MAILNEYRATYPISNTTWQTENVYVNATSMEKAVNMLSSQYGNEPDVISKIRDNVLTEVTDATTVLFDIKSYYIDEDTQQEVLVSSCIGYPPLITNAQRGTTVYMTAPSYQIEEEGVLRTYTFNKWIYGTEEWTDNPHMFVIPLDESVSQVTVKVIYDRV